MNDPASRGRGRGGRGRGRGRGGGRGGGGRGGRGVRSQGDFSPGRGGRGGRGPPRGPPQPPAPPTLRNGEKGADVHTVSETDRIRFTRVLMDFRENDEKERLELPTTLTNTERKFVHEIAGQLGLKSKSTGKGESRRISVTKLNAAAGVRKHEEEALPVLLVGRQGTEALRKHMTQFPPSHTEELESHETGASIMEALAAHQDDAEVANRLQQLGLMNNHDKEAPRFERKAKGVNLQRRRQLHAAAQQAKKSHREYKRMQQGRSKLPAYGHETEIVRTVRENPITIVSGETGCGKSTQVPQFLLDANPDANIVVTQPRRISAVSIAERVAQEQCQDTVGKLIGYQVRLDTAKSEQTQLLFMTPGVLLRQMQSSPLLQQYSTIIIDEIHERDKYQEFLLIVLRDLIPLRPDLRVVLMSATLQTLTLVDYFSSAVKPAVVEMEGRMFPVQEFYLEHILELTKYVDGGGGEGGGGQVEAELAKLLAVQEEDAQTPTLLQCFMCGKKFTDGVELGAHVAMCGEDVAAIEDAATVDDVVGMDDEDEAGDTVVLDYSKLDDYDVDEELVCADYHVDKKMRENEPVVAMLDEETIDARPNSEGHASNDEAKVQKWDGESPFDADVGTGPVLTEGQENLLEQYQGMHDDEQIDNFLLLEIVRYIAKSSHGDGAILVFLPGWQEISEFSLLLDSSPPFRDHSKYLVLPLHSGIPSKDQRRVLQRPPQGTRKIVLSTNIAETSLTIDDVAFVVDTGRAKEKNYDPHLKTSTLQTTWISQASAKQRKGRAGRTKAGVCFHLFSSRRHASLRDFTESELLRTPLEELCLMCKQLDLAPGGPEDDDGVPAFLEKAMSPPHSKAITNALELLVELGAMMPETNNLTTLGECLAAISLHPRVGKMVIWSYILGCVRVAADMAVAMSYKSPFTLPPAAMRNMADAAKVKLSQNSESDQVTVHLALEKKQQFNNQNGFHDFCRRNFIGISTMQMISDVRKNLTRELTSLGFPNPSTKREYHNRHDTDEALWQASIAAGLYPNMAIRKRGDVNFSTMTNRKVKVHVSSVNAVRGQPLSTKSQVAEGAVEFMCFGEIVKGARMFTANQTTHLASPLPLLLLCGNALTVRPDAEDDTLAILNMDDWVVFTCAAETASHIIVLRRRLEAAFWHVIADPSAGLSNLTAAERHAVEILGTVLRSAHKSAPARG